MKRHRQPFPLPSSLLWRNQPGFTIVELLIVIVVIAILAAIGIVVYSGIQNRANDAAVQSDLANLAKKLEVYRLSVSSSDQYPATLIVSDLDPPKISKNAYGHNYTPAGSDGYNLLYCFDDARTNFALAARSASGTTYAVTNARSVYVSTKVLASFSGQCPAEGILSPNAFWTFNNGEWKL